MANSNQDILLEKHDQIGYITFNRPEKLNAFLHEDYDLLDDLVNDCERDDNIRAVIVTGKGRAFTAGDDMKDMGHTGREYAVLKLYEEGKYLEAELSGMQIVVQQTCQTMYTSGKVYIAAVNGVCWQPEPLYAMDFVIAADVATFAQGDLRIGIVPGGGSTQYLPRLLGRRRAIELLLLPEEISAQDAYRIGLVNKVVPLSELMAEAEALAKKIIIYPPSAIKLIKMAVTKSHDIPLEQGLRLEQWYEAFSIERAGESPFRQAWAAARGK